MRGLWWQILQSAAVTPVGSASVVPPLCALELPVQMTGGSAPADLNWSRYGGMAVRGRQGEDLGGGRSAEIVSPLPGILLTPLGFTLAKELA